MCFVCSKEPFHRDGSFEYPQHMFWMRNKENNFPIRTLIWRPDSCHTHLRFALLPPFLLKDTQGFIKTAYRYTFFQVVGLL